MSSSAPIAESLTPALPIWLRRGSSVIGGLLLVALLHFAGQWLGVIRGTGAPRVLGGSPGGLLAGAALGAVIVLAARGFSLVLAPRATLSAVCLGLAFWAMPGGTIDDWLIAANAVPGAGRAAPYLALLSEYGLWVLVLAVVIHMTGLLAARPAPRADANPGWFGAAAATAIAAVVALAALWALMGPAASITRRGQVYFVVFLGFFGGVLAGRMATHVRTPLPYLLAVPIVGVIGLLFAAARPVLPPPYQAVNSYPVWGPARPLPVEMMSLGVLGVLWALRSLARVAPGAAAEKPA